MLRPYSTKRAKPVPVEFEACFVDGGWSRVNSMFGKNPSNRYYRALGPERLSAIRREFVRGKGA